MGIIFVSIKHNIIPIGYHLYSVTKLFVVFTLSVGHVNLLRVSKCSQSDVDSVSWSLKVQCTIPIQKFILYILKNLPCSHKYNVVVWIFNILLL